MGDWRGFHRENYNQERRRKPSANSNFKKPPSGSWNQSVPSWEKEFCSSLCLIPWRKLCETKKVMTLYKNIVQWDDSAGEEAFQNAKTRFWARINGLPCNISLPDPNIYIDDVDWNPYIDPELLSDLDRVPPPIVDNGEMAGKSGVLDSVFSNQPVPCTGWDDEDDHLMETNNQVGSGWEDQYRNTDSSDAWGQSGGLENKFAEGNSWESCQGDDSKKSNNNGNGWETGWVEKKVAGTNSWNCGWGQWDDHSRNADNNRAWGLSNAENRDVESNSWRWGCGWEDHNRGANNSSWEARGRMNRHGESSLHDDGWRHWEGAAFDVNKSESRRNGWEWRTAMPNNCRKRDGGVGSAAQHYGNNSRFQGDQCQANSWSRNGRGRKRASYAYERPIIT